jgi:hypothetical protein
MTLNLYKQKYTQYYSGSNIYYSSIRISKANSGRMSKSPSNNLRMSIVLKKEPLKLTYEHFMSHSNNKNSARKITPSLSKQKMTRDKQN